MGNIGILATIVKLQKNKLIVASRDSGKEERNKFRGNDETDKGNC